MSNPKVFIYRKILDISADTLNFFEDFLKLLFVIFLSCENSYIHCNLNFEVKQIFLNQNFFLVNPVK